MARKYPRFLFSNALNAKHPGYYIVHTIYPRMILSQKDPFSNFEILELIDNCNEEESAPVVKDAQSFFLYNVSSEQDLIYKLKTLYNKRAKDIIYQLNQIPSLEKVSLIEPKFSGQKYGIYIGIKDWSHQFSLEPHYELKDVIKEINRVYHNHFHSDLLT